MRALFAGLVSLGFVVALTQCTGGLAAIPQDGGTDRPDGTRAGTPDSGKDGRTDAAPEGDADTSDADQSDVVGADSDDGDAPCTLGPGLTFQDDPSNCGGCGTVCCPNARCRFGLCATDCPGSGSGYSCPVEAGVGCSVTSICFPVGICCPGSALCGLTCACPVGEACVDGVCVGGGAAIDQDSTMPCIWARRRRRATSA